MIILTRITVVLIGFLMGALIMVGAFYGILWLMSWASWTALHIGNIFAGGIILFLAWVALTEES